MWEYDKWCNSVQQKQIAAFNAFMQFLAQLVPGFGREIFFSQMFVYKINKAKYFYKLEVVLATAKRNLK